MVSSIMDDFFKASSCRVPERVPTVIWSVGHWYADLLGYTLQDYYQDLECKLQTQVSMQERFPEAVLLPGIWPDYGVAVEASAFGCPIIWQKNQSPTAMPAISSMRQVLNMKEINVREAGLFPDVVGAYEYMFRNTDSRYVNEYGYLEGSVFLMGPLETAAVIRGYGDFLLELYDEPKLVHSLLRFVTDTLIRWIRYLETKIGKIKRLFIADHFPAQISPEHFEEFFFPYMKEIYDAFPGALSLYHNEGSIGHVLERIPGLGASIFHFGTGAGETRAAVGDSVCLMGNLNPIGVMLYGSREEVSAACREVLDTCAPGGGLLLSTAGGLSVGTPEANVQAMLDATLEYSLTGGSKGEDLL